MPIQRDKIHKESILPVLKENPLLTDFQDYVHLLEKERGFSHQSVLEKCLLLGEEVGELFKAVRKKEGIATDQRSQPGKVEHELVDVLILTIAIANKYDMDLEKAFREKEEINKTRKWS